jgi:hypothetical protein
VYEYVMPDNKPIEPARNRAAHWQRYPGQEDVPQGKPSAEPTPNFRD